MLLARTIGRFFASLRDTVAGFLVGFGVTPNFLTTIGCFTMCCAGILLASGYLVHGAVIMIIAGAFDMLDGAVAKLANRVTSFGGVLDSSLDRFADGVLFGGLIVYFAKTQRYYCLIMGCLAITGAFTTSYVRARAENVIEKCDVGFWERGERTVYLILSIFLNRVTTAIYVLGILSNLTAVHRIVHTYEQLQPSQEYDGEPSLIKRIESALYDIVFWKYGRNTWQYDVAVTVIVIFTILVKI